MGNQINKVQHNFLMMWYKILYNRLNPWIKCKLKLLFLMCNNYINNKAKICPKITNLYVFI